MQQTTGPGLRARGSVLIVDDDPVLQALLAELFVGEGFLVMQSLNGRDGLRLARQHRPDVIVLDLLLPGLPGLEMLQRLKADVDSAVRRIPVLVLSASARLMLAHETRLATVILDKPFDLEGLLEQVTRLAATRPRAATAPLAVAG